MSRIPIERSEVLQVLRAVLGAASTDQARPVLMACHMFERDGALVVEATDSFRLYQATFPGLAPKRLDVMVPAEWLGRALPKRLPPGGVEITIARGQVSIFDRHLLERFSSPTIKAEGDGGVGYPDTSKILFDGFECDRPVAFNPAYLIDTLKACAVAAGGKSSCHPVRALNLNKAHSPWKFEVVVSDDVKFVALLMPVRVPEWEPSDG